MEVIGAADNILCEFPDGCLDRALGLDSGDRQRGDEWESAEDDETDKSRSVHAHGDLGSPMVEDGLSIVCLAALEVVVEPTATYDVECGNGGPVGQVDDEASVVGFWGVMLDVGGQFSLEGRGDVPYVVVHVPDIFEGKSRGDDAAHPPML